MTIRIKTIDWLTGSDLLCLLLDGCATGRLTLPENQSDNIKVLKEISVWANRPSAKGTGVYLKKGDLFSLIISGKVNTSPKNFPGRWEGPYGRLGMMLDDDYYGLTPANRTLESDHSGEIKLYGQDGGFNHRTNRALHPEWYKNNRGKFQVIIIVWEKKDWEAITEFFHQMKTRNPESEAARYAFAQSIRYRDLHQAKEKTVLAVEETRKQIIGLKTSPPSQSAVSTTTEPDPTGLYGSAPTSDPKTDSLTKEGQIAALETRLATLMATLEKLEEVKQELAAEKEKSARLSEELEATAGQTSADQYPPFF